MLGLEWADLAMALGVTSFTDAARPALLPAADSNGETFLSPLSPPVCARPYDVHGWRWGGGGGGGGVD